MIPVAIWLRSPESTPPVKAERRPTRKPPKVARNRCNCRPNWPRALQTMRACGGRDVQAHGSAPILFAELTKIGPRELEKHADIAGLFLYDRRAETDLSNSDADCPVDHRAPSLSITGKGRERRGWYEDGPTTRRTCRLRALHHEPEHLAARASHARHHQETSRRTVRTGTPDCNLHSANSPDLAAVTWAAQTRGLHRHQPELPS